jgi:DNA-binding NarL/FixJ family response regulator
MLAFVAQRTIDEEIRVRWFRGPVGRAMSEIGGSIDPASAPRGFDALEGLDEDDQELLRLLTQGMPNRDIAEHLDVPEDQMVVRLGRLYAKIGVSSRADATTFAFRERVV